MNSMGGLCAKDVSVKGGDNLSADLGNNKHEALDVAAEVTKENYEKGVQRLLNLAIEGYPGAVRSIAAKRNEMLRQFSGNAAKAIEDVEAKAAALSEEAKTWFMGLVPYVGLPASLIYPTWKMLRRVCLMASIYGHDLRSEKTKAKIINVFGGLRAAPGAEYIVEHSVQALWGVYMGPLAAKVPVGTIVNKMANVEGKVMAVLGKETFEDGQQVVSAEVYNEPLDPEPTAQDYMNLAKAGASYSMVQAWDAGNSALDIAMDKEKLDAAMKSAQAKGSALAYFATALGKDVASVAKDGVAKGVAAGKDAVAGKK